MVLLHNNAKRGCFMSYKCSKKAMFKEPNQTLKMVKTMTLIMTNWKIIILFHKCKYHSRCFPVCEEGPLLNVGLGHKHTHTHTPTRVIQLYHYFKKDKAGSSRQFK